VLAHNGSFYFFFNNWGTFPGVDCCGTGDGCWLCCFRDCTFSDNHTVVAYRSDDLKSFTPLQYKPLGVVFTPLHFPSLQNVAMFRPHVLFNAATGKFVMWYKATDLRHRQHWCGVATADAVGGPFVVGVETVPGISCGGDHFLFEDHGGDGHAYIVKEGTVQRLNASYTGVEPGTVANKLPVPDSWEAPVMFAGPPDKATGNRTYVVVGGHNCCACKGGSNAYVMSAVGSPLSTWQYVGDVGANSTQCALQPSGCCRGGHSPFQRITHAQTAAAFTVQEESSDAPTTVLLSNQWVTAPGPQHARNADLLYWDAVRWSSSTGRPEQIKWQNELNLDLDASL
jgi:hypothetical protein